MKLRVELVNGFDLWNLNAKCRRAVTPLAKAFGVSVPGFLRLLSRDELPGQPKQGRLRLLAGTKMPVGFAVNVGDDAGVVARLERSVKFDRVKTIDQLVWDAIAGDTDCAEEIMIFKPEPADRLVAMEIEYEPAEADAIREAAAKMGCTVEEFCRGAAHDFCLRRPHYALPRAIGDKCALQDFVLESHRWEKPVNIFGAPLGMPCNA
jgi:hypothetical protein